MNRDIHSPSVTQLEATSLHKHLTAHKQHSAVVACQWRHSVFQQETPSPLADIKDFESTHTCPFIQTCKIKVGGANKTHFWFHVLTQSLMVDTQSQTLTQALNPDLHVVMWAWYTLSQNTAAGCSCATVEIIYNHRSQLNVRIYSLLYQVLLGNRHPCLKWIIFK